MGEAGAAAARALIGTRFRLHGRDGAGADCLGVAVAGDVGFDIAGGANGLALAALRTAPTGPSSLYRIDLATGAAAPSGSSAAATLVGNGQVGLVDLAIAIK